MIQSTVHAVDDCTANQRVQCEIVAAVTEGIEMGRANAKEACCACKNGESNKDQPLTARAP